jgi:hypothetical protein
MRTAFPVMFLLVIAACSSSTRVTEREVNDPELAYIKDHDSRVSQARMRKLKSHYNRSAFGISLLNASASPAYRFDPAFAESHKELPNLFRKIKLINDSGVTIYADLIARDSVSPDFSLSVRHLALPVNAFINLLTARDGDYSLTYSSSESLMDSVVVMFKPSDNKIIHLRR